MARQDRFVHMCDGCNVQVESDSSFLPRGWREVRLEIKDSFLYVYKKDVCDKCKDELFNNTTKWYKRVLSLIGSKK